MKIFDSMIPPTVWNVLFIGFVAAIVICLGKAATAKWPVPGLTELFAAA
jgi:hypothetical protein